MKKPNGAVTLTPEEIEGLEGLRARMREVDRLGDIHKWLVERNGEMTGLQIAARANTMVATLIETILLNDTAATFAALARCGTWLIHLGGKLNVDMITLINKEVEHQRSLDLAAGSVGTSTTVEV